LIGDDFDFDGEGRAGIVSVHDGSADENVSGELLELKGIEDGAATGIDDHGMRGLESVIGRKLREVVDVLKLALAERRFQRKGPIGFALRCRARQANNNGRDVLRYGQTPEEESL